MGRLNLTIPQLQKSQRQIPLEAILQVQGNNPYAQGVNSIGDSLSAALLKRNELRKQAQQIAGMSKVTGVDLAGITDPTVAAATLAAKTNAEKANQYDFAGLTGDGKNMVVLNKRSGETELRPLPAGGFNPKGKSQEKPLLPYGGTTPDGKSAVFFNPNTNSLTTLPLPGGATPGPKTLDSRPTVQTRAMGEVAGTIIPHISELRNLINEADRKGFIGPVAGRTYVDFLAGKAGTTGNAEADNLLGRLKTMSSLTASGMLRMHFGAKGGQEMYSKFTDLANIGKQSASMLNGDLDTFESFARGYQNAGQGNTSGIQPLPTQEKAATHRWNPATKKVEVIQ